VPKKVEKIFANKLTLVLQSALDCNYKETPRKGNKMNIKTADEIQTGDIVEINERTNFIVENVEIMAWADGTLTIRATGFKMIQAGVCGPDVLSLKVDEMVSVRAEVNA
jgi:hypothetical protein